MEKYTHKKKYFFVVKHLIVTSEDVILNIILHVIMPIKENCVYFYELSLALPAAKLSAFPANINAFLFLLTPCSVIHISEWDSAVPS